MNEKGFKSRCFKSKEFKPRRATKGSGGYDFFANEDIKIAVGETVEFDSGVSVEMHDDDVLILLPRSSLGFKYKLMLDNTVGVIDSDFKDTIKVKMTNYGNQDVIIKKGQAYMQGLFIGYKLVDEDDTTDERIGGIGSTD